jgi:hypothetical protein
MKKILLSLLLLLTISFSTMSQTITHVDRNGNSYDWKLFGNACYGCASFYVKVDRTLYKQSDGFFYFYIYLYSNSFHSNGYLTSTYITNINIYSIENNTNSLIMGPFWSLVPPKNQNFDGVYNIATLKSRNPQQIWYVDFGQTFVY